VDFGASVAPILQANASLSFSFSPPAPAELALEPAKITNSSSHGDGLCVPDLADDLEVHTSVECSSRISQLLLF
jgi:hypothetical protein